MNKYLNKYVLKFRHKKTPQLMTEGLKLNYENTNITLYLNLSSKIITKTKEIIVSHIQSGVL